MLDLSDENTRRWIFLIIAIAVFIFIFLAPNPEGLSENGQNTIAIFAFTVALWITRPVSFPIIFFFTAVLLVGTGVFTPENAFHGAGTPTIFFLVGAIIIAFSLSKYNLDKRIALTFLKRFGGSPSIFLFGIILISAFLSMTMPAHGVVALLIPIVLSILRSSKRDMVDTNFSKATLLSLAYGSSVGSMGTLLGGARNPLAISIYYQSTGQNVSFINWFLAAAPLALVMLFFLYIVMIKVYPPEDIDMKHLRNYLEDEVEKMGEMSFGEKKTLFFLILAFILWISFGTIIGMATVAVFVAGILGVSKTLTWEDVEKKLPWGIIFLYAGALTLAHALTETGASSFIASNIISLVSSYPVLVIFSVVVLTIFLSELMSNSAATGAILPITLTVFAAVGLSQRVGMYVVALPSAFAFMFIIGTPGSAMVYDTGLLRTRDFLKPGLILNFIGIAMFMSLGLIWWKFLGLW
ncbi:MAG: DASS family sodium-coupled anion symporter [Candidatus Thermoplasmatota archaeon]